MIKILEYTKNPITKIGKIASICTENINENKYYNIGINCLKAEHGRTFEAIELELDISKYSARMIRELYTMMIGVTKLQSSTRYVNMNDFSFYTPYKILGNLEACRVYVNTMLTIKENYKKLIDLGIPKEDVANILPLGSHTKMYLKINLRALIHLFEIRTCNRVYEEFRDFMIELKYQLEKLDEEWNLLTKEYLLCKCDKVKMCKENKGCGKYK